MLIDLVNDSRACSIESVIDSSVITNKAKEGHTLETGAVESVATVASVASVSRSWRESDPGAGSW